MGGKSKSSQSSSTVNNVDNRVYDFGEGGSPINMIEGSENVSISATDHGAIDAAFKVTDRAYDFGIESLKETNLLVNNTVQSSMNTSRQQVAAISDLAKSFQSNGQSDLANNMQNMVYALTAGAVVIVVAAMVKKG